MDYTYDKLGRLSQKSIGEQGDAAELVDIYYDYWASKRNENSSTTYQTTQVKTEILGGIGYQYEYDDQSQLIREDNLYQNKTIIYTYDNGGNLLSKKEYGYTTAEDLSGLTPSEEIIYTYDSTWKDKLFSYCFDNPVNMSDFSGHMPSGVSSMGRLKSEKESSLPVTGKPNSSQTLNNPDGTPKQKRWYGPDGKAERDRDYNHPGKEEFPYDHVWDNGKRGKEHLPQSPDYEIEYSPLTGAAMVTICSLGMVIVAVDDITGFGVANDFLIVPFSVGIDKGLIMLIK